MGVNGIYGLSGSGLDIESLVKVGMMSKQNEYDKMAQKYTKNEWTKNALVELNNQITTFNMSTLTDYKLSSNMNARTAESSNEAAVTATATAKAIAMPHRVDVEELSSNAYLISSKTLSDIIIANNSNMSLPSNAEQLSEVRLKDLFFRSNFTDTPTVTSAYSLVTTSNASSVTYDTGTAYGKNVITSTTVDRNNDGTINYVTYKDAAGTSSTLSNPSVSTKTTTSSVFDDGTATITENNGSYKFVFGTTTTYTNGTSSDNGATITFTKNNSDYSTTTTTVASTANASDSSKTDITITKTQTYSTSDTSSFNLSTDSNGVETLTFTKTDGNSNTLGTTTATFTSSTDNNTYTLTLDGKDYTNTDNGNTYTAADGSGSTVTLTKDGSGSITSLSITDVKTYTGGSTTIHKEETVSGTDTSNSYLNISITSDTAADGTITTSATTKSVESGYFGSTLAGTAISSGFGSGTSAVVLTNGNANAINFSISDGVNEGSIDIKYSFDELYKPTTDENGDTKYLTITDLVSEINKQSEAKGLNITATYEYLSGRFFLYNKESGANNQIIITANDEAIANSDYNAGKLAKDFFNTLGLSQSKDGTLATISGDQSTITGYGTSNALTATGSYAKARVDGVLYDKIENNKLTIDSLGITYNLYQTTTTNAGTANAVDNPVTVTVGQDISKIIDKVKSFIEDYNKILGSLYEKYDEKPESGYSPLTQSQKDSMKDEQIEKWEEKAKQGLLYHDQTLSRIINQMRNAVTASVKVSDDESVSIFDLGISTTGIKGQLTLNEDKLKAALEKDSEIVYKVFAQPAPTGTTANRSGIVEEDGIAQRLGTVFTDATKLIRSRAGSSADITEDSTLNNLLRELQTKMSNFKKLMTAFEDKLYKKYDAMEVALSKLGSQLNYITGGQ